MIRAPHKQRGATLMVSLVILVMLTLFAISMINSSSLGLRIASNFQTQKVMEQNANEQMENIISVSANFDAASSNQPVTLLDGACVNGAQGTEGPGGSCTGGYRVNIVRRPCLRGKTAEGYTKKIGELAPLDVDWEITASMVDPVSNRTHMRITEGVRVRMLAGSCPY